MSDHAEAVVQELELNKETLQDLGVDGFDAAQVRGGAGGVAVQSGPSVIQPTIAQTGTSVIQPTIAQTGGTSVIRGH